jgi:hypothetical protein
MGLVTTPEARLQLTRALGMMTNALEILDTHDAPGEIGSTLDLAIARLERAIGQDDRRPAGDHHLTFELKWELAVAHAGSTPQPCPWEIALV